MVIFLNGKYYVSRYGCGRIPVYESELYCVVFGIILHNSCCGTLLYYI